MRAAFVVMHQKYTREDLVDAKFSRPYSLLLVCHSSEILLLFQFVGWLKAVACQGSVQCCQSIHQVDTCLDHEFVHQFHLIPNQIGQLILELSGTSEPKENNLALDLFK